MSDTALNSLEKRAAFSLASVFGLRMLGLFMLMPVFAIYGQELEGFSPIWIGLAIGAYGLTQALLQIPMGILSDRFGRRPVIVGGLILFAIGSVIAATADDVVMVTVGRAIQGMGAIASAVLALAADVSRDEQRPKVMAVIGMCIGISFALALVAGPLIAQSFGLAGLFWITAGLAVLGIGIVTTLVPTTVNKAPKGDTIAAPQLIKSLIRHPQLLRLDIGVMLLHMVMTGVFISLPNMLVSGGIALENHWHVYLPVLGGSFVLMVPFLIIGAKKNLEKQFFVSAVLALGLALAGLYIAGEQLALVVTFLTLFFVAFNFLEASLPALVARICPAGQKGSAMGIFSSSQFMGAFLGGAVGGLIADIAGGQMVFAAAAVISLLWAAVASGMKVPQRSKLVTLATPVKSETDADELAEKFVTIQGVIEATVVFEENRTYLKVEANTFNLDSARQLLA